MSIFDSPALYLTFYVIVLLSVVGQVVIVATAPAANMVFTNPAALANYNYVINWVYKLDAIFVFLFIGGEFAILYRASHVHADFIQFAALFVVAIVSLIIMMYCSNIFSYTLKNSAFARGVGAFPLSIQIIENGPIYQGIFVLLYMLVVLVQIRNGSIEAPGRDGIYG